MVVLQLGANSAFPWANDMPISKLLMLTRIKVGLKAVSARTSKAEKHL